MLNIHDLVRLTSPANKTPIYRTIVFDGKVAVSMAHSYGGSPWWAAVPFEHAKVAEPVVVPVDCIKQHFGKSRNLHVAQEWVHNNQGTRTEWEKKTDWRSVMGNMPPKPDGDSIQFDLDLDALDRVLVAINTKDFRPTLTGVFFDFESGRIAATDGHRMHCYHRTVPKLARKQGQSNLHLIVPKEPAHWLLKSDDKQARVTVWRLGKGESLVMMQTSQALVYTMAIEGKYPEVMRVVPNPANISQHVELNPIAFSDAVASMGHAYRKKHPISLKKIVAVHWGEGRVYAGDGPEFLAYPQALNIQAGDVDAVAKALFARYQAGYLQDLADCVTPKADWCIPKQIAPEPGNKGAVQTASQAVAVFDGDFVAVVMPVDWKNTEPPTDKPKPQPKPKKQPAKPAKAAEQPEPAKADAAPATGPAEPDKPALPVVVVPESKTLH